MNGWCVKTPDGKMVVSSFAHTRTAAKIGYIDRLLAFQFIQYRADWAGSKFYSNYWKPMAKAGFKLVHAVIEQKQDASLGFSWPECREVEA